jgi:hypothetical protein
MGAPNVNVVDVKAEEIAGELGINCAARSAEFTRVSATVRVPKFCACATLGVERPVAVVIVHVCAAARAAVAAV